MSEITPELEAIRDAIDKNRVGGRDRDLAVSLSDDYVIANPSDFTLVENMEYEQAVALAEVFRDGGQEREHWTIEAWIFHKFEKQNIGGKYQAQVRVGTGPEQEA